MANTAAVYARIDPKLKSEVETILARLGVTPSSLIQMLYNQIEHYLEDDFSVCRIGYILINSKYIILYQFSYLFSWIKPNLALSYSFQ